MCNTIFLIKISIEIWLFFRNFRELRIIYRKELLFFSILKYFFFFGNAMFLNREIFYHADEIGWHSETALQLWCSYKEHLGNVSSRTSRLRDARGSIKFSNVMTTVVTTKAFMRKILQCLTLHSLYELRFC